MTEDFLHYIWQHQLYLPQGNQTTEGEPIEPIYAGLPNIHSGPDFIDARVRIGDTLWVGCVEIHLRSSDWERHGHHNDPAYNNVVLHVVYEHDVDAFNARKQKIPTMELHFDPGYYAKYQQLIGNKQKIACQNEINTIDEFTRTAWLDRLTIERLEQKANAIKQTYALTGNNWEEAFYQRLARNFGFSLNSLPFEALAKSLPFDILLKHRDHLPQLEALLFGQAGMLEQDISEDAYYTALRNEHQFLRRKYNLVSIDGFLWKFLRLRPINFPTLRIAQFADLMHRNEHLCSHIIEAQTIKDFEQLFRLQASEYWDTHYVFGKISKKQNKVFGQTAFHTVMINTIVPFLFMYGKMRGKEDFCTRAVHLLEHLPPEKNAILTQWETLGIRHSDAFTSQALLQLKNEYCAPRKCLHCAIGNNIVRNMAKH